MQSIAFETTIFYLASIACSPEKPGNNPQRQVALVMPGFCGLRPLKYKTNRHEPSSTEEEWGELNDLVEKPVGRDFHWNDQLSVIIELDSTRGTPQWEKTELESQIREQTTKSSGTYRGHILEPVKEESGNNISVEGLYLERETTKRPELKRNNKMSERSTATAPPSIQPPPRDVSFSTTILMKVSLLTLYSLNRYRVLMPP